LLLANDEHAADLLFGRIWRVNSARSVELRISSHLALGRGRIHIEKINNPVLFEHGAKPAEDRSRIPL
jgi:hypothetical protein